MPPASMADPQQSRRMSSPIPPPAPLDLPEPPSPSPHALAHPSPSRSPLRKAVTLDPVTGTLSEDGSPDGDDNDPWGTRGRGEMNGSPSPSITKFASSFAQRVGSLMSSVSQPESLPTEAEIEAEAESQRERSRREAERILTQEAVERKKVEERVLEMLEASRTRPNRSQTMPSPGDPPSPTPSNKEGGGGWWSAAKNRLTPTKDKELTPAQQIVLDTKAREKEKSKGKDKEWLPHPPSKYIDPTYQSLSLPPGARPPGGMVGGGASTSARPVSPVSPSPQPNRPPRQLTGSPTPSPSRSPTHSLSTVPEPQRLSGGSPALSATSSRDPPPLYAQFSNQGTLDVPATLVTIARRFEKLERWAVGHVRALEERMSDVEKWLVEKERERERSTSSSKQSLDSQPGTLAKHVEKEAQPTQQVVREVTIERVEIDTAVKQEVSEMKDELGELQGRVGELGREMARLASNASNIGRSHSVSPSSGSGFGIGRIASPSTGPNTPGITSARTLPAIPVNFQREFEQERPQSPSAQSIVQSETASIISTGTATRTKLPYPTGDYTSPSPPSSPRPSTTQSIGNYTANNASSNISRTRPMSYSGLPIPQTNFSSSVGVPRPSASSTSVSGPTALPLSLPDVQPLSVSPAPRKRYTVALGQPLSSSPSTSSSSAAASAATTSAPAIPALGLGHEEADFGEGLFSEPQTVELQTAFFSRVPGDSDTEDKPQQEDNRGGAPLQRQETIGKTPITLSRLSLSPPPSQNSSPNNPSKNTVTLQRGSPRPSRPSPSNPRTRAQSTYGVPGSSSSSVSSLARQDHTAGLGSSPSPSGRDREVDRKASWKTRSRSIDRVGLGIDAGVGNFVDPLVVRKKEKEAAGTTRSPVIGSPGGARGRVAFGDLLAFFDAEKQ
ncbi:hypothetical protein K439DRAFT_1624642 [Ramaria rubella]|nr:hypothetical protein K439DRAFT_1624642 [Ramaria rubella]